MKNNPYKKVFKNKMFKILLIFFISLSLLIEKLVFYYYFGSKNIIKPIVIEIDISEIKGNRGPASFSRGLNELLPFRTSKCLFKSSKRISIKNSRHKSYFFYVPTSVSDYDKWVEKKMANKLIFGPNFVPARWFNFPNKDILYEERFREILTTIHLF